MEIKEACEKNINDIIELLKEANKYHSNLRPDLFNGKNPKYNYNDLLNIIHNPNMKIYVCIINDKAIGHIFMILNNHKNDVVLNDFKTLYIDDLFIKDDYRGKGIGHILFDKALEFAKENECYNITLSVWAGNNKSEEFYKNLGMNPQKTYMEYIIK